MLKCRQKPKTNFDKIGQGRATLLGKKRHGACMKLVAKVFVKEKAQVKCHIVAIKSK